MSPRVVIYRRLRCAALTRKGRQCLNQSHEGSKICGIHIRAERRQLHIKVATA